MHNRFETEIIEKIIKAKKEWETTVDTISEGVVLYETGSLAIRRVNWPLARMLNKTPQTLVGANLHQMLCGCQDNHCPTLHFLQAGAIRTKEIGYLPAHQQWFLSSHPLLLELQEHPTAVVVVRDVTQEHIYQDQVAEAEKQALVARAATGLVGQITPSVEYIQHYLTTVEHQMGRLRAALADCRQALPQPAWDEIETRHKLTFVLDDIECSLQQSIHDLLNIHSLAYRVQDIGKDSEPVSEYDLHQLLEGALSVIWGGLQAEVQITRRYAANLPRISANAIQLQRAITDLVFLAAYASEPVRELLIETTFQNDHLLLRIQSGAEALTEACLPPAGQPSERCAAHDSGPAGEIILRHGGLLSVSCPDDGPFCATVILPVKGPQARV
ncbi:MAG: hypothetical protein ACKOC5_14365 [Chloroflexota bacterium]